jgi:hypothetical protein
MNARPGGFPCRGREQGILAPANQIEAAWTRSLTRVLKDKIPWTGEGPLPLYLMCKDSEDGPLTIPLHSAAEQSWKDQGYLP